MTNLDLGAGYAVVAQMATQDLRADPEGMLLYVEAGDGWVEPSLYQDVGDKIIYRECSWDVAEKLFALWKSEDVNKRWAVMKMKILHGSFSAEFRFDDELDPGETSVDRTLKALKEEFGDKPVDYEDP